MGIGYITRLFDKYSVSICGSKGSGKDLVTANVIARRRKPYVSNMDYNVRAKWYPFEYNALDVGGNTYKNFISGEVNPYTFPYPDGTDVYISDAGIYFPSQYNGELNRDYKEFPTFMAISRHVGDCRVHINSQNPNRTWDKIREQNDYWLRCKRSYVLFGKICITTLTEYDKYESALARVRPCRVRTPLLGNKVARMQAQIYRDQFYNQHGIVRNRLLIYWNKSKYNTRQFKEIMNTNEHPQP